MKLLLVTWRDVVSKHLGWGVLDEMKKERAPHCQTIGWEVQREYGELMLVSTICDDEASLLTIIPEGMILSEKELSP